MKWSNDNQPTNRSDKHSFSFIGMSINAGYPETTVN
jgi:hypothetical protein